MLYLPPVPTPDSQCLRTNGVVYRIWNPLLACDAAHQSTLLLQDFSRTSAHTRQVLGYLVPDVARCLLRGLRQYPNVIMPVCLIGMDKGEAYFVMRERSVNQFVLDQPNRLYPDTAQKILLDLDRRLDIEPLLRIQKLRALVD